MSRFLTYVVNEKLAGRCDRVSQNALATDVFDRDESFDPAVESIVRVEAGRLRTKLRDYYDDLGNQDRLVIILPKGSYTVRFQVRPTSKARAAESAATLGSANIPGEAFRPAVAVLPFDNMSDESRQQYFADGIAEDLITELSRVRWLLVTARNSTFTYKGRTVDVKEVGRDLGVRYVVQGSIRKEGERVRISAQLIDACSGIHLWAERYDRDLSDFFTLQDELAETLVAALQGEIGEVERERAHRKHPNTLDAWEFYQRGMWHLWRMTAKDLAEAARLFRRATDLDPSFAQAIATLAYTLRALVFLSFDDSPLATMDQALRLANRAVALDDKEAMAHLTLGRIQTLRGEYDVAIEELRMAIDLNPSLALAHQGLGRALALTEKLDEAISEYDTAIRLSPRDPLVWVFYGARAGARFQLRDYEAAAADARRAIRHPAASFWPYAYLASAMALLDRREEATIALDKLLEIKPDFSVDNVVAAHSPFNPEALRPRFKSLIDGLRKAGLDIPDEPVADD
jgi:adenylate cyclase